MVVFVPLTVATAASLYTAGRPMLQVIAHSAITPLVPGVTDVTTPVVATETTPGCELAHVKVGVMVLPAVSTTSAANVWVAPTVARVKAVFVPPETCT